MASQLSAKLNLDVTGYQKGIDDASKATEQYKTQLKSLTKDIPNLAKETRAAQKETLNLTLAISRLTEEERNSAEGKAMIKMLEESKQKAAQLTDMLGDTRTQIKNMASDTLELDAAKDMVGLLGNSFASLQGTIGLVTGDTDKMKKAVTAFTTVQSTLNAVTSIGNVIQKQSSLLTVLSTKYTNLKKVATNAATAAQIGNTAATKAGKIGQESFNVALAVGKALLGDWKSLLLAAGVALGGYAAIASMTAEDTKKLEEEQNKAKQEEEALMKAQNQHDNMIRDKYVNTVADLRSKYDDLKDSYKQLKTEKEKSDWIKKHQKDFEQLGFTVKGVDDANKVLIANADKMIEYFDLVGQAAALAALKIEAYQEAARLRLLQKEHTSNLGQQFSAGSELDAATGSRYGLKYGTDYQWKNPNGVHDQMVLTAEGAAKANAESARQSSVTRKNDEEITKQEQRIASIKEEQLAIDQQKQQVAKEIGVLQASGTSSSTSSSSGKPGSNTEKWEFIEMQEVDIKDLVIPSQTKQALQNKIKKLQNELDTKIELYIDGQVNPEYIKKQKEIAELQEKINKPTDEWTKLNEEANKSIITAQQSLSDELERLNEEDIARNEAKKQAQQDLLNNSVAMMSSMGQAMQNLGNEEAAQAMQFAATSTAMIADIAKQIPALMASSLAKGTEAASSVPFPGNIAAIAAIVADIMAIFSALPKFANGGVVKGPFNSGDRMLARVNNNEMILNGRQQSNLFNAIDKNKLNGGNQSLMTLQSVKVRGADLYLTMKNYEKTTGKKL